MTFTPAEVETAIARVAALEDASARAVAHAAVRAVMELHAEGLRRMSERLRAVAPDGERALQALAEDEVVASLFLLHEIHPQRLALEPIEAARDLVPVARLTRKSEATRCELCGRPLSAVHEHLIEVERRKLRCTCPACALLFDTAASKLRRVRPRASALDGFRLGEAQWSALGVPVALAFFFHSSALGEVIAAYPGPAGATESVVPKPAWAALVEDNPVLAALEPDTCALLVERLRSEPRYHLLSIDACYRLAGMLRSSWQGMTGGDAPLRAVEAFFRTLPGAAR